MFESHPVPQNISSYQFRLVGDMTLKQFFQLAAGVVVALLFYALPLPNLFRWPLIGISVLAGAAFAFLPVQERPLEEWITAFFRSIYAPTIYVWKKYEVAPQYFQHAPTEVEAQAVQSDIANGAKETETAHPLPAEVVKLDQAEINYMTRIANLIKGFPTGVSDKQPQTNAQSVQPAPSMQETPAQVRSEVQPEQKRKLEIPKDDKVQVVNKNAAQTVQNQNYNSTPPEGVANVTNISQTMTPLAEEHTKQAQFSPMAAPPIPPTQPNIVVGQVIDSESKIVDGAILEIKDNQGRPVRALKSNKAGHFRIVTPLPNGTYHISTEKEGLQFDTVSIELAGSILQPIAVRASNTEQS